MKNKKCAICGDLVQSNVKLLWKRDSDDTVFHVCLMCAESGKVNKDSVKKQSMKTYTTYLEEAKELVFSPVKPTRPKTLAKRSGTR